MLKVLSLDKDFHWLRLSKQTNNSKFKNFQPAVDTNEGALDPSGRFGNQRRSRERT